MRPVAEAPSLKMWPVFWAMIATAHERVLPAFIASGTIEDPGGAQIDGLSAASGPVTRPSSGRR